MSFQAFCGVPAIKAFVLLEVDRVFAHRDEPGAPTETAALLRRFLDGQAPEALVAEALTLHPRIVRLMALTLSGLPDFFARWAFLRAFVDATAVGASSSDQYLVYVEGCSTFGCAA